MSSVEVVKLNMNKERSHINGIYEIWRGKNVWNEYAINECKYVIIEYEWKIPDYERKKIEHY